MIRLVALYGVGDAYLVSGLARAVRDFHRWDVMVTVKPEHSAVPALFPVIYDVDPTIVFMEGDTGAHERLENSLDDGARFYVHPHFLRSGVRVDRLTAKPRVSQADMYRALLRLPIDAPLAEPRALPTPWFPCDVLVITDARSWPNMPAPFWDALVDRLRASGLAVTVNDRAWSLSELFCRAAGARHVIGPQCGVMSVLCEAGFPCGLIFVLCDFSASAPGPFGITSALPYGDVETFAGNKHAVGMVVVKPDTWEAGVDEVAQLQLRSFS